MQVEPWFSHEVGKDFLKRENGGVFYCTIFGEEANEYLKILKVGGDKIRIYTSVTQPLVNRKDFQWF